MALQAVAFLFPQARCHTASLEHCGRAYDLRGSEGHFRPWHSCFPKLVVTPHLLNIVVELTISGVLRGPSGRGILVSPNSLSHRIS